MFIAGPFRADESQADGDEQRGFDHAAAPVAAARPDAPERQTHGGQQPKERESEVSRPGSDLQQARIFAGRQHSSGEQSDGRAEQDAAE